MSEGRKWYTEPETFVGVAALIVSISAVAVGIYEASLQRKHDRAEVWPHVELEIFTSPEDVTISVRNSGIGPAIIKSMVVSVDGKPRRSWPDVVVATLPQRPDGVSTGTIVQAAIRPGDKIRLLGLRTKDLPPGFIAIARRVSIRLCYTSVFDESWTLDIAHIGDRSVTKPAEKCTAQPDNADF